MSWRAAGAVVAVGALSGCWLQPGNGPGRPNANPLEEHLTVENVDDLQQAWASPMPGVDPFGQPLDDGFTVFTGGFSGGNVTVRAVGRGSGAELWQRDLPTFLAQGGEVLSIADGEVLTLRINRDPRSVLETLDAATGATLDSVTEDIFTIADARNAAVGGGVIAYRMQNPGDSNSVRLVVRDRATLDLLWTALLSPDLSLGNSPVLIAHDQIYVRDGGQAPVVRAYALNGCGAATCEPVWTAEVPFAVEGAFGTDVGLMAATDAEEVLVRAAWSTGMELGVDLVALTSAGAHAWTEPMLELDGVAVAGDTVYAAGVDATTPAGQRSLVARGPSPWRADVSDTLFGGAPIVAGGVVYVGGGGNVQAFPAAGCGAPACDALTTIDTGPIGGITGMSVSNGTLFVHKSGAEPQLLAFTP